MTEEFLDKCFADIRFKNKDNAEKVLSLIDTHYISKLIIFRPDVVSTMRSYIDMTHRLVNCRQFWKKLNLYNKRAVLVFLYRNRKLFIDNGAISWNNLEKYEYHLLTGESWIYADLK